MKIRFKTRDGLVCIKECYDIELPVSVVMSPLWNRPPRYDGQDRNFQEYRKYEFKGEVIDGIPTVEEA